MDTSFTCECGRVLHVRNVDPDKGVQCRKCHKIYDFAEFDEGEYFPMLTYEIEVVGSYTLKEKFEILWEALKNFT